ncbi:MAG: ornithine cyclodeaminase family protein [Actinomycetota bacterium]|nr:MAG: ornithine cyclodeaminase family protein [Actinomycetota bacterium]
MKGICVGVLILRPNDHYGLVGFSDGIECMRKAFEENATSRVRLNNPRTRMNTEAGFRMTVHQGITPSLHGATTSARGERVEIGDGGKQRYIGRGRPVFSVFDTETADLLMVMLGEPKPADYEDVHGMGGFHTACCAAYATDLMARKSATRVGVLGSGGQAQFHLGALAAARQLSEAVVYSPTVANRESFAETMTRRLGIPVTAVASTEEVIEVSEILLVCTNSNVPVLDGALLKPGTHVTSIVHSNKELLQSGLIKKMRQEIDDVTLKRSELIVTTSIEQEELDQPEVLYGAAQRGVFDWNRTATVGDLITGRVSLPSNPEAITFLHNPGGWGIGAGAFFRAYYDKAVENGVGLDLQDVGGSEIIYGF